MTFDAYRIHRHDESPATVLDARRPDGWVASDEVHETQPRGVSCCATLGDLARYVEVYSMGVQAGDVVLGLRGACAGDRDRDEHAIRLAVQSYAVLWQAADFVAVAVPARGCKESVLETVRWYVQGGDSVDSALVEEEIDLTPAQRSILDYLLTSASACP
jgi:hypothetical protein